MATQTFFRKANVSRADATASLFKKFPNADLISFEKVAADADAARSAGVKEGDEVFAATIRVAEFPPSDDSGSDDSGSEESAPKKEEKSDSDSSDSDSSDNDSSSDDGGDPKPEFGAGDGGPEGHEPKKLSPEEQTVHLLQQILDQLKGGAGPAGPDPLGGPGLPDVGAPGQGDTLPPPGGHGAPGAPLPPPVKEKSPVGVGAFAHVADRSEISFVREDANEINNSGIMREAAEVMPTHKVAKIQRTGTATINGNDVALADHNIAVVTLVKR